MVQANIAEFSRAEAPDYRVMPHNEEAEQALLGAMLVNNDVLQRVEEFLLPEHFFIPVHSRIYEAIRLVVEKSEIANPIILRAYFENDEALDEVGGASYLARLAASAATIINAPQYGQQIKQDYMRRQLIGIGGDMVNDAFEHDLDNAPEEQIDNAEKSLYDLAETGRTGDDFRSFRDVTLPTLKNMEETFRRGEGLSGLATGLEDLDEQVGGLNPSDLIVLAARPGMGKTSFVTNIAVDIAKRNLRDAGADGTEGNARGAAVAMFSLEMSAEQLVARVLSEESRIPSAEVRRGRIKQHEFEALVVASQTLSRIPFYIDDTPAIQIQRLRARARRMKRKSGGLSLVIVDYLQLVRPGSRSGLDNRVQEVGEITQGLKALAKELDVPIIACAQLSRAVEQREDKRPLLSDLRESGSIEQDADIVMFLYREAYYYNRQMPQPKADETQDSPEYRKRLESWQRRMEEIGNDTEIIVAKHRHGPTGSVTVHFDEKTTKFSSRESRYTLDDDPY